VSGPDKIAVLRSGQGFEPPTLVLFFGDHRTTGRLNVFQSYFYTNPRLQARVPVGALRNGDHSDRADVRFVRPNIQIHDAPVVDLYQWVCARYLVGVKGCRNKGKAQLSSALDRISERITLAFQTLSRPEAIRGSTIEN
jgi:hypothetical protein